jgi:YidC/Oxa1 family membrane protein insertase
MEMDKRTILALILSIGIIFAWNVIFPPQEINQKQKEKEFAELRAKEEQRINQLVAEKKEELREISMAVDTSTQVISTKTVSINDDFSHRIISSGKGVHFDQFLLNKFRSTNALMVNAEQKVNIINSTFQNNGFYAKLFFNNGDTLALRGVDFELVDSIQTDINLRDEATLEFRAKVRGEFVYQRYTFYENRYDYTVKYDFSALSSLLRPNGVGFEWRNGLPYSEENFQEDDHMSLVVLGGEDDLYRFDTADDESESFADSKFNYFTIRSKYFIQSIIPTNLTVKNTVVSQRGKKLTEHTLRRYFVNFSSENLQPEFIMVTGPYDRTVLNQFEAYGLDDVFFNASGYEHLFSIFSKPLHFILVWMNGFIGSFGISIILFTLLLKLLLYPLTKKSYKGMKAMSELQPRMQKLKEKHGNNTVEMQHAMRNLYAEAGVNPLAGCLPMLLQMPLLFSLFHVFRAAVELRGESFLWIANFSAPDALPIGLDAIGFATINLLPILLAVSQILTSKQTMTDPNQKAMVYIMPLVMMFMFYNWNAALNFYYLLFNVFTSAQQHFIKAPERKAKAKEEVKLDGFEQNEKAKKIDVTKNKKQMYKKKN